MRLSSVLLACVLALACVAHASASVPAQTSSHASPVSTPRIGADGLVLAAHANEPTPNGQGPAKPKPTKKPEEKYLKGTDFMGKFGGVPLNPTAHLQRSLAEDKQYVASILRAPVDLGDPTDCKHSDIVKDEQELRKIALRINHRRVSLRQQQHWIDSATEGLKKIETEISQTTNTARNLAEQLDALTAQKEDITNHVRRAVLLKELDRTSSNLMRLKNSRMKEEIRLQKKHNSFALKNHEHNKVLDRLNTMRTKHGLALGKLDDPKPYRFAQVGMEEAATEQNQQETEVDAEQQDAAEAESESQVEAAAEAEKPTEE